jgi:dihydroxy-acid dehydratase
MGHAADVPITLKDFQDIALTTPYIADLRPSGKYLMADLQSIGGTPAVLKYLLAQGMIFDLEMIDALKNFLHRKNSR